jgi:hypothetical protein
VHHDEFAVARRRDVEFPHIGTGVEAFLGGDKGILRCNAAETAVRDHKRTRWLHDEFLH